MNRFPRIATLRGAVDCVRQENNVGPDDDDDDSDDDKKSEDSCFATLSTPEES